MHKIPLYRSFRFRFILLVLGVQIAFALLAGTYLVTQQMDAERQKSETHAQASLKMASGYVRNSLQSFSEKINLLAVTPALANFDPIESGKLLKTYKVASLFLPGEKISLYDNHNILVANNTMVSSQKDTTGYSDFHQIVPLRTYMGKTWRDRLFPVRTFAVTVQNYARANGVLTADFSFRRLQDFLKEFHIGHKGFIILAEQDGTILWHPDAKWTRNITNLKEIGIKDFPPKGNVTLVDGISYSVQCLPDTESRLHLLALVPQSEIEAQVRKVFFAMLWLMLGLIVAMSLLTLWISGLLAKPLQSLAQTMEKVKNGDLSVVSGIRRGDEIGTLAEVFDNMRESIRHYIDQISAHRAELQCQVDERTAELVKANYELKMLSRTDDLTGIPNRRDIMEKIQFEYHRSKRSHQPFAIILGDIDKFKRFNDTYGHDCGDVVLRMVAQTLQASVRKNDYLSRWGGEEFLIVLPETTVEGTLVVAERIRSSVEEAHLEYEGKKLQVTITLGVAFFDEKLGVDQSIQNADQALYLGKQNGRNRVEFWNPGA